MEVIVLLDGSGPLLDLLRRRYGGDEIYTFTGNILISINPYRFIPGLYAIPAAGDGNVIAYSRDHIPHVFTIAELSYDTMMRQVGPVGNRDTLRSLLPPPPPPTPRPVPWPWVSPSCGGAPSHVAMSIPCGFCVPL
jgi:hypothetical protein